MLIMAVYHKILSILDRIQTMKTIDGVPEYSGSVVSTTFTLSKTPSNPLFYMHIEATTCY